MRGGDVVDIAFTTQDDQAGSEIWEGIYSLPTAWFSKHGEVR